MPAQWWRGLHALCLPFAASESLSPDISPFTKWTRVLAVMDKEKEIPEAWRRHPELQGLPPEKMAIAVNKLVNMYPYVDDMTNWGRSDYWVTPAEFYARGGGDCEDFAIVKYGWLHALGVPEENMRLAVVYDVAKETPHTVLVFNTGTASLILDNQEKDVRLADAVTRYQPVFSINRYAWWLQTGKPLEWSQTVVASGGKQNSKKGHAELKNKIKPRGCWIMEARYCYGILET